MKKLIFSMLLVLIGFNGCSSDVDKNTSDNVDVQSSPIKISLRGKLYFNNLVPCITVTSLLDSITINNIVVNKGNCKYTQKLPKKLLYGQDVEFYVFDCNVIRVDVETNKGDWYVKKY